MMKRLVIVLAVIAIIALFLLSSGAVYHQAMVVTGVESDIACLVTVSGYHSYEMHGAEDLLPGDIVSVLMFTRLTKGVPDDVVIAGTARCS